MLFRGLLIIPADKPPGLWLQGGGKLTNDLVEAKTFETSAELIAEARIKFADNKSRSPMLLVFLADGTQFLIRPDNLPPL